ncbi:MAG: Sensor histidine kinase RcsC [Syntrophus sp. SKADARSKE-3]|nr:Sensor histidine kinase RcsC [Syntrophus sp. SKADARSKE-3]
MEDQSKTKQVLIQELAILRQRVEELEQSESEWKKEKEELKKSESLFRSYFDLPLYGIAITSPEKGWIQVNDRICSIMGYSRDEIVCKTWSEMTHPDDLDADDEQFSLVLSGKIDQYNMDKRFIRKDGGVIWTNISVGCVRKSDGSVDHMVCVVEDITSARLAGEALRQERTLYEDLVTTEPAGVYRLRVKLSSNWQAESWSSIVKSMYSVDMASVRCCNILGISHEEFMTNAGLVRDLIHSDDIQDFDLINMEAMTRLTPFTWEGRIIRAHQTRWIHFESLPRVLDSETVLWTGIVYDITDRKRAEEALRESEERLRLANKATNDVVWDWDVIQDTQQWNESGKVVFGWTDIVEHPQSAHWWVERVHPEDLQRISDGFFAVVNNPEADYWHDEYRFRRIDGSYANVIDRGHVLRDKQGKAIRMIGAMLDITDRKRAEEALRDSEERFRKIFDESPLGIVIALPSFSFEQANPSFCNMMGYSVNELRSMTFADITHPDYLKHDIEYVNKVGRGDIPFYQTEKVYITKTGTTLWANLIVSSIRDEHGELRYYLSMVTDITDRKQAEEERIKIEERLIQSQKMETIGTLAGGIAHDFNNILSAVIGFTELAQMKLEDRESIEYALGEILKAGIRARDLVKQILTFSSQTSIKREPMMLAPLIKENLKFLRASLPVTIDISQDLFLSDSNIIADPVHIHRIVMNICTNAAYAMREKGGMLDIRLAEVELDDEIELNSKGLKRGRYLQLSIADTGSGIPKEIIHRIFDPFFTTKERGKGTGMGLSVVHGIVKDLGGAISVYSEPSKGTTFHVLFPKYEGNSNVPDSPSIVTRSGSGKILFVDDEEAIIDSGSRILEQIGYEVVVTTSPIEALEIFRTRPDKFDLVLTDMTMPKMTGLELSEQLLKIRPDIPIVLCTGFSLGISAERIKNTGIKGLIMKPMIASELANAVNSALKPNDV